MPLAIGLLLFLGLLLLWQASRRRRQSGLPGGRVIYADVGTWQENSDSLYDPLLDLTGKPDYLVRQGDQIVPVEVKSGRTPNSPYDSHIFQLAAYCLLVQRAFGRRPTHGIIRYPQRSYEIEYTVQLEQDLLDLIEDVRRHERKRDVDRSHHQQGRCEGCGFRRVCEQRL
jgi:CRISPR-associated exonuclease Cas4